MTPPFGAAQLPNQDDSARNVCHECVGDEFLAAEVKAQGVLTPCGYCNQVNEGQPLEALAARIHEVLHEHFERTPGYPLEGYDYHLAREGLWEQAGYPVADVIVDMAGVSEKVARDVTDELGQLYDSLGYYEAVKDGGELETAYGSDDHYEERRPDDGDFRGMWAGVRDEIGSRARFFNAAAEEMLGSIFEDLEGHKAPGGRPVVRQVGPNEEDRFVWRARVAQSARQLKTMLESPSRELGPPPSHLAKGGRMNAPGIPVFYGGMERSTCVAEVRAPVGSHVVVAKFELLRTMRLLDLDVLEEVYAEGSCFDPHYAVRKARAAFLQRLAAELSHPVIPQDEAVEYLATQVVAEFLGQQGDAAPRRDHLPLIPNRWKRPQCCVIWPCLRGHALRPTSRNRNRGVPPSRPPRGTGRRG